MPSASPAADSPPRPRRWLARQTLAGPAWFAVVVPPAVPVLLWLRSDAVAAAFASPAGALRSLALLAGVCGFTAFATNIVLSARVAAVERLFGGLERMYRFHRRLAAVVAGLLAAHVVLLFGARAVTPGSGVADLLRPDPGWRTFSGVVAFAGFAAVLGLTLFARLRHEPFLRAHRAFGVVFAVGALHALRVPGLSASVPGLGGYLAFVTAAAMVAWVYRSGLGRTLVRRSFYQVAEVRPRGDAVTEVVLEPADTPLEHEPGQHVFVGINDPAVGRELHPFSIVSAPGEPRLRLAVKAVGDFTSALPGVQPGAWVRVEGPFGGFWHDGRRHRRQLWIAGGIGITPFLSMAASVQPGQQRVDLYYCDRTAAAAVFLDDLAAMAAANPDLRLIPSFDDEHGLLTVERVRATSGDLAGAAFYLCGPPGMMAALTAELAAAGVPPERITAEGFRLRGAWGDRPRA